MSNKFFHIKRAAALLLAALTMLMLGCTKNGTTVLSTPTPAPVATAVPEKSRGGELIMPIPVNADRENPLTVKTEEMLNMFSLIFDKLIDIDDTGRLVPALAESFKATDDGRVWTVVLRQGVTWHSGAKFTADDVMFTFARLLSEDYAESYYAYYASKIEKVEAPDKFTLEFTMKEEGFASLYALAVPICCESKGSAILANGTGAYRVSAFNDSSVSLAVNENWWKEPPNITRITCLERVDNETALASYAALQLNMVCTSLISASNYKEEGKSNVLDIMTQNVELMVFNHDNPLLANKDIRRAINYAINPSVIVTNVYMNRARMCDVPVAPDSWLYNAKAQQYEYNPEEAALLFEAAGYVDLDGDGTLEYKTKPTQKLQFTILVNDTTDNDARLKAAELIAEQLETAGVKITLKEAAYSPNDPASSSYINSLNSGNFDIALVGINLSRDVNLTSFFEADGANNFGNVKDSALLTLAQSIITAESETQMREQAHVFQARFADSLPFAVLYFRLNSIVYSSDIYGLTSAREPDTMRNIASWYFA